MVVLILCMILCVAIFELYETPICGDCGNRFKHSKDCWRSR